jgi:uncharacterized protein YjcR
MAWVDLHEGILEEFSDCSISHKQIQSEIRFAKWRTFRNRKEIYRLITSDIRAIRDYRAKHDDSLKAWNVEMHRYEKTGDREKSEKFGKRISEEMRISILGCELKIDEIAKKFGVHPSTIKRIRQNAKQVV